ncbi:MAG: hypothetical protein JSR39_01465 [Verrucomicrobia bacterium]|nr:hypothetical protein [Verrucomicrobiota bacterium]
MREIAFQANWTRENCLLQYNLSDIVSSPFHSTCQKIYLCFTRTLQYINEWIGYPLHQYAKQYLVGGMRDTREQYLAATQAWIQRWEGPSASLEDRRLRLAYEPFRLMMTTPDGVQIEGTLYRSLRSQNPDIPTIICTNPNWADISRENGWNWLLDKGLRSPLPFNIIVFDFRACAGQAGELHTPGDLTLDADCFYQFAQRSLHVSEPNIHFIGFCTGAQVAATLAALHPSSGRLVSHNSTYNIGELMHQSPFIQEEAERNGTSCFCLLKELVRAYIKWSGWAMDVSDALNTTHNRTLFTHHAEDRFVPRDLHAYNAIDPERAVHTAILRTKPTVQMRDPEYAAHWMPLFLCEDENGLSATKKIVNFILGQDVFHRTTDLEFRNRYIVHGHRNRLRDIELVRTA